MPQDKKEQKAQQAKSEKPIRGREKWYKDRSTLIALITGFISSVMSIINVLMGM